MFVESVWEYLVSHISEKVNEIRSMSGNDVQKRLETVLEIYKEDVRVIMTRVCESQQYLVDNVRDVVGEMGNQIIMNSNRNNKKDEMLLTIRASILVWRQKWK